MKQLARLWRDETDSYLLNPLNLLTINPQLGRELHSCPQISRSSRTPINPPFVTDALVRDAHQV
jgi:hypothetical protein